MSTFRHISCHTVAGVCTLFLGLIATVTLLAPIQGYPIPVWFFLVPAVLLFIIVLLV